MKNDDYVIYKGEEKFVADLMVYKYAKNKQGVEVDFQGVYHNMDLWKRDYQIN